MVLDIIIHHLAVSNCLILDFFYLNLIFLTTEVEYILLKNHWTCLTPMCEIFFAQVAFNKHRKLFSEGAQTLFKQSCRLMHLQSQALIVLNEIILCFKRFGAQCAWKLKIVENDFDLLFFVSDFVNRNIFFLICLTSVSSCI